MKTLNKKPEKPVKITVKKLQTFERRILNLCEELQEAHLREPSPFLEPAYRECQTLLGTVRANLRERERESQA